MQIVDRSAFLKLPKNTVFQKYAPCSFGPIEIKGETREDDYLYEQLTEIDADDCYEYREMLIDAEKNGVLLPLQFDITSRDGLFDKDQLFAVWSQSDVTNLVCRLGQCLEPYALVQGLRDLLKEFPDDTILEIMEGRCKACGTPSPCYCWRDE